MELTRRFNFCASHRLFRPEWSDEKNTEIFGLCSNPNGHGHNYEMEVTVSGTPDPETGMVTNLKTLKQIVNESVILDMDHKDLNKDVPWMAGQIPTTEVLAEAIWQELESKINTDSVTLEKIKIWETKNNIVTRKRV
jgi:6-pyruvoyltetrahydropterin/6-carboxytetrahydropterin synthase